MTGKVKHKGVTWLGALYQPPDTVDNVGTSGLSVGVLLVIRQDANVLLGEVVLSYQEIVNILDVVNAAL